MSWHEDESSAHSQYMPEEHLVGFTMDLCCIMCNCRHRTFSASKWDTCFVLVNWTAVEIRKMWELAVACFLLSPILRHWSAPLLATAQPQKLMTKPVLVYNLMIMQWPPLILIQRCTRTRDNVHWYTILNQKIKRTLRWTNVRTPLPPTNELEFKQRERYIQRELSMSN